MTKLPEGIKTQIADIIEAKLKKNKLWYVRQGTTFSVSDTNKLLKFQEEANLEIIERGVLTRQMLIDDAKANGLL